MGMSGRAQMNTSARQGAHTLGAGLGSSLLSVECIPAAVEASTWMLA